MQTQSGLASVNNTRLYYEAAGSGDPLVLIHGFTLDTRMWDDQFEPFAQRYQVVRYDARGFGQSAVPDGSEYTHADDLLALLNHLGIERAHVVGLSMGGGMAIDFALDYPQATCSLVLVDSVLGGYTWQQNWGSREVRAVAGERGVPLAKVAWLNTPLFKPAREQRAVELRLYEMVHTYSGWHWENANPLRTPSVPAIQRLSEIRAPTLIVLGERDLRDFHAIADTLQQQIPNARTVLIPHVGHMSNMEDPEHFNDTVLNFLASL